MTPNFTRHFEKTAGVKLSLDPSLWRDKIFTHISKVHPYIAGNLGGDIDWSVDPIESSSGDATGTMIALIGETPIQIPIIVRNFELKNPDIYLTPDGDMDVLDKEVVLRYNSFNLVDVGQKIGPQDEYRSNKPHGSLLSKVAHATIKDEINRVGSSVVESNPGTAPIWERMLKRAALNPPSSDAIVLSENYGSYKLAAFSNGRKVKDLFISRETAFSDPSSKLAHMAREARETGTAVIMGSGEHKLAEERSYTSGFDLEKLRAYEGAIITKEDGNEVKGILIPIDSLEGLSRESPKTSESLAFIGDEGSYLFPLQGNVRPSGKDYTLKVRSTNNLDKGRKYFVRVKDKEGTKVSGPFIYRGTSRLADGALAFSFHIPSKGVAYFIVSESVSQLAYIDNEISAVTELYLAPISTRFIEAKSEVFPATITDAQIKQAFDLASYSAPVQVSGGLSSVVLERNGMDQSSYTPSEAIGCLISMGATRDSAEKIVKTACEDAKKILAYGLPAEEVQKVASDSLFRFMGVWADARHAINKLAEELEESEDYEEEDPEVPEEDLEQEPEEEDLEEPEEDIEEDPEMLEEEVEEGDFPEEEEGSEQPEQPFGQDQQEQSGQLGANQQQALDNQEMTAENEMVSSEEPLQDQLSTINLLNQYNATKFRDATPELEEAKKRIANVLYKIRTGEFKDVSEDVVKDGLVSVNSIIKSLAQIQASDS